MQTIKYVEDKAYRNFYESNPEIWENVVVFRRQYNMLTYNTSETFRRLDRARTEVIHCGSVDDLNNLRQVVENFSVISVW